MYVYLELIKKGLEANLDFSIYVEKFNEDQICQIRLGLVDNLDVSQYAKPEISAKQMRQIREKLKNEQNTQ